MESPLVNFLLRNILKNSSLPFSLKPKGKTPFKPTPSGFCWSAVWTLIYGAMDLPRTRGVKRTLAVLGGVRMTSWPWLWMLWGDEQLPSYFRDFHTYNILSQNKDPVNLSQSVFYGSFMFVRVCWTLLILFQRLNKRTLLHLRLAGSKKKFDDQKIFLGESSEGKSSNVGRHERFIGSDRLFIIFDTVIRFVHIFSLLRNMLVV